MRKAAGLAIVLLVGAGGCKAIYGPAWQPRTTDTETEEATDTDGESEAPEYDEVDPFGTDPDVPDEPADEGDADDAKPDKSAKGADSGGGKHGKSSPKKGCSGLDESTCKITMGCAWDSVKNCTQE